MEKRTGHRPRWSKTIVVRELRRWKKAGSDLSSVRIREENCPLFGAAKDYFGSYKNALRAAGIDYERIRRHKFWTKESVLALIAREHRSGRDMVQARVAERLGDGPVRAAKYCFGSYRNAIEAAGLPYPPKQPLRFWSRHNVLDTLRSLSADGVDLRQSKVRKSHSPLFLAAVHYFGAYGNAIVEAGINYEKVVREQLAREARERAPTLD
jgi:hypothetical protein